MSMAEQTPMKPADQTNFLLGELSGKVGSLQQSVENSHSAQSLVNATNESDHAEFRRAISELTTGQAVILARQTPKTPWYLVVAGVVGIITGIGALIALIAILYRIAPAIPT